MKRAALAVLVATTACSLLTSYEGFDEPKGGADAAPDAAPDADVCARRRWPAPPAAGSDSDVGELVSALSSMRTINTDDGGVPFGFDLDNLCSCPERVACIGAQPNAPCDAEDSGVDNGAAELFALFSKATQTPLDETGLRLGLDRGKFSMVFRMTGWNGEPDDPDVSLQVLNAFAANPGTDAGARFDGNDVWTIDAESLGGGRFPTNPVRKAYVAGGILVAELPVLIFKARIPTTGDKWLLVRVALRDAHVTGRIARSGAGFTITDGTVGGRSPSAELLRLSTLLGACPGALAYETMKPILCDARDVPLEPAKDGRDVACEAISLGVAFEAKPAKVTANVGTPVDPTPCGDAGSLVDCR